jgi:hypothetical protein
MRYTKEGQKKGHGSLKLTLTTINTIKNKLRGGGGIGYTIIGYNNTHFKSPKRAFLPNLEALFYVLETGEEDC